MILNALSAKINFAEKTKTIESLTYKVDKGNRLIETKCSKVMLGL